MLDLIVHTCFATIYIMLTATISLLCLAFIIPIIIAIKEELF